MSEVGSVVNGDLPSRRAADAWLRETTSTVQRLSDRVSALERDVAVTNSRLNMIDDRVAEIKKGIDDFVSAFYEHRQSDQKQKTQMLAWVITTLLSVIGSGGFVIYELLKINIGR